MEFAQRLRAQHPAGRHAGTPGRRRIRHRVAELRCRPSASLVASDITEALASPLRIDNRQVPISASMGISIYPDNATDIDTLMQQADAAMYKAKQAGRSTHRFFSADMNRLAEQRLVFSAALRQAIANDRLKLRLSAADPDRRRRPLRRRGAGALARS